MSVRLAGVITLRRSATALAAVAALSAASVYAASGGWMRAGLEQALDRSEPAFATGTSPAAALAIDPSALRLSRHEAEAGDARAPGLAIGDTISFGTAAGETEVMEVVAVVDLPIETTRLVGGHTSSGLKLVTARAGHGAGQRIVRFVFENAMTATPTASQPRAKAL